ncbi:MAG TPA: caspase family protein, partial [Polymorphobacter sp.]|nr:caspase family protein [Polymorphobacter sp.]
MPKTYALLVGINDYPAETRVAKLQGCVTDVENFHGWLTANVAAEDLDALVLTDAAATRAAIIDGFRKHLGKARKGDIAV